jgi:hypothetical protein
VKATDRENGCTATDSLVIEYGFSQCVGVGDDWPGRLIGVYPNPVNEVLYLETRDLECELKVILTNLAGQGVLPPIEISPHTGSSIFPVQVETRPGGIYLLRMLSESYVHVEKIIIH